MSSNLVFYSYEVIIPVILAVLITIAIVRNSKALRIWTVVLVSLSLLFREFYVTVHGRFVMAKTNLVGDALFHFDNGMRAVEDYCWDTSLYVIVVLILLLILCIQGFSKIESKGKTS